MTSWQESARPRFGFLSLADGVSGQPGPELAALLLRATDHTHYFCVPADSLQAGFAAGLTELPACDDNGDEVPDEVLRVEYAGVPSDQVYAFGEAQSAYPAAFGSEGLWPEASSALLAVPPGFGEEVDDFASAEGQPPPRLPPVPVQSAMALPGDPPAPPEVGGGRLRVGAGRGAGAARPTAAGNAAEIALVRDQVQGMQAAMLRIEAAVAGRGAPMPGPPGMMRAAAAAVAPGLSALFGGGRFDSPPGDGAGARLGAQPGPLAGVPAARAPRSAPADGGLLGAAPAVEPGALERAAAMAGAPPLRRVPMAGGPLVQPPAPPGLPRPVAPPVAPSARPPSGIAPGFAPGMPTDALAEALRAFTAQSQATTALLARSAAASADPMMALMGGTDDLGGGAGAKLPGARGAAALEVYRRQLESQPAAYTATIRRNARRAMSAGDHDTDPRVNSMREFLTRSVPFGQAKGVAYLGFGMATVADYMAEGQWEKAEATVLLLFCAVEQASLDRGRWSLAWLLTHLPEPPWGQIAQTPPADALRPFGRLSEPAWTAAAMAYTKDAAALNEMRRKAPWEAPVADAPLHAGPRSKAKARSGAPPAAASAPDQQ